MWREKTDKRLVAAGLLILALVIGYNAWSDMQPKRSVPKASSLTAYTLVSRVEDVTAISKDNEASAIFWAGDIAGDPPIVTVSPIKPVSLTQQETMPLFRVEELPRNFSPLFTALTPVIKPWATSVGIVNDIYIDYRNAQPDLDTLGVFTNGLRGHFEQQYWIVVGLRRTATELPHETRIKLGNMLKSVEYFVYYLDDVVKKGETLAQSIGRIDKEGVPFMLRASVKPDYEAFQKELPEGKQYFGGFILDLGKTPPEEKTP